MTRSDALSLLTQVSGMATLAVTAGVGEQIDAIAPGWGKKVLATLGIVSFGAGIIVRFLTNPTPTNTVQVFDRTSGSVVEMKTVAAPAPTPAPPPIYTPTKGA